MKKINILNLSRIFMLEQFYIEFIKSFWILFPAYAANCFPVFSKFLKRRHPMDGGKYLGENRILGDGKSWEGIILGFTAGFLVGLLELYLYPSLNLMAKVEGVSLPTMTLLVAVLIPLGTLTGDTIGSFIKRRYGMKRGGDAIFLDQLNFVVAVIIFVYFFTQITPYMIAIMLVATFLIHRAASMIGYRLKIKREPW